MSKYQVRLGENVTDKIVNCGAGVYWYIDKLQSIIANMEEELMTLYLDIMEYNEDYAKREIKKLKGVDKE